MSLDLVTMGQPSLKKILIIQTAFLGDVILATSLIEKLHQHYPESGIDFLLRKGNEKILAGHPFLEEVLVFDKKSGKYKNLVKLIFRIRKRNYDLVINVQRYFTTGLITLLSGAPIKAGFDKNPLSRFFSLKVKHSFDGKHETERNHELISWMTDGDAAKPKLYPATSNYEKVDPLKNNSFICIAPSSVWFTKQFPVNKWVELISSLPDDLLIYLVGSPADFEMGESIKNNCRNYQVHNLCGQLDILDTAALMKDAMMNIVNDSAPMHIASSVNAPVCAVFCSTIPAFGYGPLSEKSFIVEYEGELACRPCGIHGRAKCPEGHFKCALVIRTERIREIIVRELQAI